MKRCYLYQKSRWTPREELWRFYIYDMWNETTIVRGKSWAWWSRIDEESLEEELRSGKFSQNKANRDKQWNFEMLTNWCSWAVVGFFLFFSCIYSLLILIGCLSMSVVIVCCHLGSRWIFSLFFLGYRLRSSTTKERKKTPPPSSSMITSHTLQSKLK